MVPPQASFRAVTDTLFAHGLIRNKLVFRLVARVKGLDRSVKAGVYDLPRGAPMNDLLARLAGGQTASARFTAPEGLTIPEIAAQAARQLAVPAESVIAAARDPAEVARRSAARARRSRASSSRRRTRCRSAPSARDVVRAMARSFQAAWRPEWTARLDTLRLTQLQLVALASIVEGEARADEEREVIAGVYHNRLRIGMALQADPTVQYAIMLATGSRKPRLYTKDYRFESPYNTYLHPGLPPGPVNSPGRRSIEATLYPARVPICTSSPCRMGGTASRRPTTSTCATWQRVRGVACDERAMSRLHLPRIAIVARAIPPPPLDVHRPEYPAHHRHAHPAGLPHFRHILRPHAADRDAGHTRRECHHPCEARGAERRAGVRLRCRRSPRSHAPVVRPCSVRGLFPGPGRGAYDKPRRGDAARQRYRQIVRTQVHPRRACGDRHIRPIVHQHRNSERGHERARETRKLAHLGPLEPELHRRRPAPLGRARERDDIAARHERVVSHEHQPERRR